MVNIGAEGRQSDGGIFRSSEIGKRFEAQTFNIPQAKPLEPEGPALPFVLVADEAFPLSNYIMRPYPHNRYLDISKKVFNYRLSRARRVVESAFGILVAHWRIFRKPLIATVNNATLIVQAAIVLHNFILQSEEKLTGRKTYTHQLFQDPHETSNGIRDTTVHRGRSTIVIYALYFVTIFLFIFKVLELFHSNGKKQLKIIFKCFAKKKVYELCK